MCKTISGYVHKRLLHSLRGNVNLIQPQSHVKYHVHMVVKYFPGTAPLCNNNNLVLGEELTHAPLMTAAL